MRTYTHTHIHTFTHAHIHTHTHTHTHTHWRQNKSKAWHAGQGAKVNDLVNRVECLGKGSRSWEGQRPGARPKAKRKKAKGQGRGENAKQGLVTYVSESLVKVPKGLCAPPL